MERIESKRRPLFGVASALLAAAARGWQASLEATACMSLSHPFAHPTAVNGANCAPASATQIFDSKYRAVARCRPNKAPEIFLSIYGYSRQKANSKCHTYL